MARPKDADSAVTLEKIRDAAVSLLNEGGPEHVSFRKVAGLAGVSVGTVRYYFESREAIVEACLDAYQDSLGELEDQWAMVLKEAEDLDAAIRMTVVAAFDLLREKREMARLRLLSSLTQGGLQESRRRTRRDPFMNNAVRVLAGRTARDPHDVRLAIDSLMRLVGGYAACADDELIDVTGADDADAAFATVRAHVANVAVRLLLGA